MNALDPWRAALVPSTCRPNSEDEDLVEGEAVRESVAVGWGLEIAGEEETGDAAAQQEGGPGPTIAPGVMTVGMRRPATRGTLGTPLTVTTNSSAVTIPEVIFHHYDEITGDRVMPAKFNMDLIRVLQERIAPTVFTPRAVYDGRKNLFACRRLPLSGQDSQTFDVTLEPPREGGRPPKVYKVILKRVAEINPTLLARYQKGQQSYDPMISTALAAINVVVRMEPIMRYPHNSRSFFTDRETWAIGGGIELWRGYSQSVRPGLRSMLMNIDVSTGAMYAPGPMIDVCRAILGDNSPHALVPGQGLSGRNGNVSTTPKVLRNISNVSAANYNFTLSDGTEISVAQYFLSMGITLQYPNYVCIEVIDLTIGFDRFYNMGNLVMFVLKYMRQFGITVSSTPERCLARVLPTPALNYGAGSKRKQIKPVNGSWNLAGQKFFKPAEVTGWAVVVYDTRTVRESDVQDIIQKFKARADSLGIRGLSPNPPISYPPAQALDVHQHLHAAGTAVFNAAKKPPSLFVIIIPDNSADLYQAIKHFGDVKRGVPTQCLDGFKAKHGNDQYWANVCLKVNAKLGGINSILDPQAREFLSDPSNPAMVIGAAAMHPPPGIPGRPSFVSVVGSIDSTATHYSAVSAVQSARMEIFTQVEDPVYELIDRHMYWKREQEKKQNVAPKRILYYRTGVSEGQFQHVLELELPGIKAACSRHKINPLITVVVVGKRHHVRFFPTHGRADRSGNCPAGTVVDDVVVHPNEFDFYLQSHGGLLGTARPTHYSVLHDENNFTPDSLQALSFALCHVARATRSVSIPAPVYYAHIVCGRAGNHYDPSVDAATTTNDGASSTVQRFRGQFQPIHASMQYKMLYVAVVPLQLANSAHMANALAS
ncbi:hypothetical protein FRC06_001770, partial [Ceratobasidium sp. 370]